MTLPKQKHRKPIKFIALAVIVAVGVVLWYKGQHPAEAHPPVPPKPTYSASPAWPTAAAESAIGIKGSGVIAKTDNQKPRPIASVAKVITALAILEKHPLAPDQPGPMITITEADEQLYRDYVARNGTVVLVKARTTISQRDALLAMLLPSANNVADTTAIWAFGSLKAYRTYANDMLQRHGLTDTTIGTDASGLNPSTKSTAADLVRIGELALNNPTITQIVALPSATIPVAGWIPNYNAMVTKHGYTGLKPGESVEAGNTLLFSTDETINGGRHTIIGAILGTQNYSQSNEGALQIVDTFRKTLHKNN